MSAPPHDDRYGYVLALLALLLGFVAGAVHLHSRGVFIRDQIVDFGASRTGISLSFSMMTAAAALFAPVLGVLLDRYPIRRVMAAGALWLGLGFLLLSQVQALWQFALLSAIFVAAGTTSIGTGSGTALMVNWFDRRRGMALAIAISGYSLASFVMGPVSVRLLDAFGWRRAYLLFAAVILLVCLPLILGLVRNRTAPAGIRAMSPGSGGLLLGSWQDIRSFLRDAQFWRATALIGAMSGVYIALNVHFFLYLLDRGFDADAAAWVLALEGLMAILGKPLWGALIDRWGTRSMLRITASVAVAATAALSASPGLAGTLVIAGILGLTFGTLLPLQAALVSRMYGAERYARAFGVQRLAMFPLAAACPLVFGAVYDLSGSYRPAFLFVAGLLALMMYVGRRLNPCERTSGGN